MLRCHKQGDAVVELDDRLCLTKNSRELAALLLKNGPGSLKGVKLTDLMPTIEAQGASRFSPSSSVTQEEYTASLQPRPMLDGVSPFSACKKPAEKRPTGRRSCSTAFPRQTLPHMPFTRDLARDLRGIYIGIMEDKMERAWQGWMGPFPGDF